MREPLSIRCRLKPHARKEHPLSLLLRKPEADDYVALSEIHNAQNEPDHRHPPETFRRWDAMPKSDPYAERYVGVLDGEVVATGYRCHSWGGLTYPGRYWVDLYVRHDHQNKGVDTQMLHHALKDLKPPAEEFGRSFARTLSNPPGSSGTKALRFRAGHGAHI